jgi:hypothetical protein
VAFASGACLSCCETRTPSHARPDQCLFPPCGVWGCRECAKPYALSFDAIASSFASSALISARSSAVGIWDIGDAYTHTRRLIPSMQLRCAAYHVFQSRRDVDNFIAIASCKANAGFSSRE